MTQHRSISQRLKRAKSAETKKQIALEWSKAWKIEQDGLVNQLGQAIARNDYDAQCIALGELRAITDKRMTGLMSVINTLTEQFND